MNPSPETAPCAECLPGPPPLTGHARLDARSRALGGLIAQRLREQPELLDAARAVLARWHGTCSPRTRPVLEEWEEEVLNGGLAAAVEVLTGGGERETRLRQSSPFAGERFVSRRERRALWRKFAP